MLQLILKSHLAFLLIPLITLALEPSNPSLHCDRFLSDADKAACTKKIETQKLDWYASSACALQDEDKNFLTCLDEIQSADFNPEALELCAHSHDISDQSRLECLHKIKNKDYSRAEIKACSEGKNQDAITACLSKPSARDLSRTPASKASPKGFQSLEVRH